MAGGCILWKKIKNIFYILFRKRDSLYNKKEGETARSTSNQDAIKAYIEKSNKELLEVKNKINTLPR